MKLKIEKGIPLPPKRTGRVAILRQMKVGDSILVGEIPRNGISSTLRFVRRKNNFKFTQRKVDGGIRVWRIS